MIRTPIAAGVIVLCICSGGTAWAKRGGWSAPRAIVARGDATFGWQRLGGRRRGPATLEVVERAPNGRLRRVQALQTSVGEMTLAVAVNGRDDAIVAWVSGSLSQARVWCATRRHGG